MVRVWGFIATVVALVHAGGAFAHGHLVELRALDVDALADYFFANDIDVAGRFAATGKLDVVTDDPSAIVALAAELASDPKLAFEIRRTVEGESFRAFSSMTDGIETYDDPAESLEVLRQLEATYPAFAKVYDLNEWLGLEKTAEGRAIYALQVSTRPDVVEDEPKLLVIGQHHARELMTHHIVTDSADTFLRQAAAGDQRTLEYLEGSAIWFVPVVNPDGLHHVFAADRMWRKNRARNGGGSRGVDLNRNYAFKWGACGTHSSFGDSPVFKGPSASSEPEVRLMDKLNDRLHAEYVVSYHSYGDEVLYPYLCGSLAEEEVYYDIRNRLADRLGYRMRPASSSGEDFEHHYARYGSISFLIEVGSDFQPSFDEYRSEIWPTIGKSVPFLLQELHGPTVHIRVKDAVSEEPLRAALSIDEIPWAEGESRTTDAFGSHRWRLKPGAYTLRVQRDGYQPASVRVEATGGRDVVEVRLEPVPPRG